MATIATNDDLIILNSEEITKFEKYCEATRGKELTFKEKHAITQIIIMSKRDLYLPKELKETLASVQEKLGFKGYGLEELESLNPKSSPY